LVALACLKVLMFLVIEVRNIRNPYSANYGEGHVQWMTMQILDRHSAYQPVDRIPYVVYPYTPLYMLTARFVSHFAGDLLLTGRWLSLASTLAIALVVGLTVFLCLPTRAPLSWRLASATFGGAQLPFLDSVLECSPVMRVDMLALLLSFSGLAVFIFAGRRQTGLYAAVAFFVLALFTKQATLPIPATCLIAGLLVNWRQTVRAYAFGAVLGITGLAGFTAYFGRAFLYHVFPYNVAPFSWSHGLFQIGMHLDVLTVVAAATCFGVWNGKAAAHSGWLPFLRRRLTGSLYDRTVVLGGAHLALAVAWTLSIGKAGASSNYFLEWDIGSCLVIGLFVFRLLATRNATRVPSPIAAASYLLVALIAISAVVSALPTVLLHDYWRAGQLQDNADSARVVQAIHDTPGPVISEDLLLSLKAGKPVIVELATVNFLRRMGRWDERPLVEMLEQRRIGLVVVLDLAFADRYSPSMKAALKTAYALSESIGDYSLYRPRPQE
jgi:hypothetical protein